MKASKIVSRALSGNDGLDIIINGEQYTIPPPTIKRIAQACVYLVDVGDSGSINDLLKYIVGMEDCAKSLSVFITGDESLAEKFQNANFDEVVLALTLALDMISARNFLTLLASMKNVQALIARPK